MKWVKSVETRLGFLLVVGWALWCTAGCAEYDCNPEQDTTRCGDNEVWICSESGESSRQGFWSRIVNCSEYNAVCTAGDYEFEYYEYCTGGSDEACAEFPVEFQVGDNYPDYDGSRQVYPLSHMCVAEEAPCADPGSTYCSDDGTFEYVCTDEDPSQAVITMADPMLNCS